MVYYQAAEEFADTGRLTVFGHPLILWPPGLPVLLGLLARLGLDPATSAVGINVAAAAGTVVLSLVLATRALGDRKLALAVAALVALSASTARVFVMLWSEPLFTVLTLTVLVLATGMLRRRRLTLLGVGGVVTASALACTIRIAGVALLPVVLTVVALAPGTSSKWRRTVMGTCATVLASTGILLVMVRNSLLGAPALGSRSSSGMGAVKVVGAMVRQLGRLIVPDPLWPRAESGFGSGVATLFGVIAILIGLVLVAVILYAAYRAVRQARLELVPSLVFVVAWFAVLGYSELTSGVDAASDRLIVPALAPLWILIVSPWSASGDRTKLLGPGSAVRRKIWPLLSENAWVLLVAVAVATSFAFGVRAALVSHRDGLGYSARAVQDGGLFQALRQLPAGAVVAADDPWRAYWASRHPTLSVFDDGLPDSVSGGEVLYVALFQQSSVEPGRIGSLQGISLAQVHCFGDGCLYRVRG